jgi:hypothetical protein
MEPNTLVGTDIGQAAARLGAPQSCVTIDEEVHLGYLDDRGALVPDGIVLVDGVVVRAKLLRHSPPMLHAFWIGQPIERLLQKFGPVLATQPGPVLQTIEFAALRVSVHEGRVVLAEPRPARQPSPP